MRVIVAIGVLMLTWMCVAFYIAPAVPAAVPPMLIDEPDAGPGLNLAADEATPPSMLVTVCTVGTQNLPLIDFEETV